MGFNAEKPGYPGVQKMVEAFCASEDEQLGALSAFIKDAGLNAAMRGQVWVSFARAYMGPDFQKDNYDKVLEALTPALRPCHY